jgi:hypothetical protein
MVPRKIIVISICVVLLVLVLYVHIYEYEHIPMLYDKDNDIMNTDELKKLINIGITTTTSYHHHYY